MFKSHSIVTEQLEARRLLSASTDTPPLQAPADPGLSTPGKDLIYELDGIVPGDTNGDGIVNLVDFTALAANFGLGPGMTVAEGDFTGDGFVTLADLNILAANFGFVSGPESLTTVTDGADENGAEIAPPPSQISKNPFSGAAIPDPRGILRPNLPTQTT